MKKPSLTGHSAEIPPGAMLVSVKTTCAVLDIGPNTLYKLLKEGRLDSRKIGKGRRVTVESIKAFVTGKAA